MSKIKLPTQKKRLSLQRDCRNNFHENSKASRKNIPRSKQRQHQHERRTANQTLFVLVDGQNSEDEIIEVENIVKSRLKASRVSGFKKWPDIPLGEVLKRKRVRKEAKELKKRIEENSKKKTAKKLSFSEEKRDF